MPFYYVTAASFIFLMDLSPSNEYLTKDKHRLLHPSCLAYGKVIILSRIQIKLHLIVSKFQLHFSSNNYIFIFCHRFNFWINASSTVFNDIIQGDFDERRDPKLT